jgi:radical SAM superfamily enzyme YgiQ (UPF0313 family)
MKALLINTPAFQYVEDYDQPEYPHIGLGYIAGWLEKNGVEVGVVDAKLERLGIFGVLERIKKENPEVVGITSMTHDFLEAVKLAKAVKKHNAGIKLVIGGIHATALPLETLKENPEFDFLVYGEGEETFLELIKAVENGKKGDFGRIKGLGFRSGDGGVKINPAREWETNLDKYPMPAWHLFPKCRMYHIATARGCPYSCVFCMRPYGKKVRERSPENVLFEIEHVIRTYEPEIYRFNDETFAFNRERAVKILNGIIERGLQKTKKHASMRANMLDAEILELMKKAGFVYIDLGIETGDEEVLKRIKKGITFQQVEDAVKMIKKAGIKVGGNYIIGHPGETLETARKTIAYAVKLNCDFNAIGLMVPYPKTEVAEMASRGECGYRLLSTNWKDYNKQIGNALELEGIPRKKMEWLQATGYVKIYLYNLRLIELAKFLWHYRNGAFKLLKKMSGGKKKFVF